MKTKRSTNSVLFKLAIFTMVSTMIMCSPEPPNIENVEKAVSIADDIATDSLMPFIEKLVAARSSDVHVNCDGFESSDMFPACHLSRDASVKMLAESFESMGYVPDTAVLGSGNLTTYNVFAEYKGHNKSQEVVLLGCHLDAFYGGADDNGSAMAVMLETARAVRNYKFSRTIRFVAFDLEEYGAIGSTRYVEAGLARDIVSGIVMDLVGYSSDIPGSQKQIPSARLPSKGDFLLAVGNTQSSEMVQKMTAICNKFQLTKLVSLLVPGDGVFFMSNAFMRSDHGVLWFNGVPIIFLTDTANFRNPHYHKETDTPETLNETFLANNAKAIAVMVANLAEVIL